MKILLIQEELIDYISLVDKAEVINNDSKKIKKRWRKHVLDTSIHGQVKNALTACEAWKALQSAINKEEIKVKIKMKDLAKKNLS